jgi:hypothetical protein
MRRSRWHVVAARGHARRRRKHDDQSWSLVILSGRDRRRSGDLPLFRRPPAVRPVRLCVAPFAKYLAAARDGRWRHRAIGAVAGRSRDRRGIGRTSGSSRSVGNSSSWQQRRFLRRSLARRTRRPSQRSSRTPRPRSGCLRLAERPRDGSWHDEHGIGGEHAMVVLATMCDHGRRFMSRAP